MEGVGTFLAGQFTTPPVPNVDLTGRTIVVTGANSGLGLEAAKLLAQLKCTTIVLACRSTAKGEGAKEAVLKAASGQTTPPAIIPMELEMTSFESVKAFANRCKELPRLDSVILNAGVDFDTSSLADEYETSVTVNAISTFLLATLLVPTLRQTATKYNVKPKIAVTGSFMHFLGNSKDLTQPADGRILTTLSDPKQADMKGRYPLSKLLVMLLVKHLASILTQSANAKSDPRPLVVVNNVAPGFCRTDLFRSHTYPGMSLGLKILGRPSEHGARTLVHGATAGTETHGQYLSESQVKRYSKFVKSSTGERTGQRLWDELSVLYERVSPGCTNEL